MEAFFLSVLAPKRRLKGFFIEIRKLIQQIKNLKNRLTKAAKSRHKFIRQNLTKSATTA